MRARPSYLPARGKLLTVSPRALAAVGTLLIAAAPATARAQPVPIDGGLVFCTSDSDCGNPYLACAPTALYVCRDPDASADANPALADAAICPVTSPQTLDVCVVRYQLPCDASASCGPAGFTCSVNGTLCNSTGCSPQMRCQSQYTLCSSDTDCPAGWSCYSPAGGPHLQDAAVPKACYPPFATFNGPGGGGGSSGGGPTTALADAGSNSDGAPATTSPGGGTGGGGCAVASSQAHTGSAWLIAVAASAAIARKRRAWRRRRGYSPSAARSGLAAT